MVMRDLLQAVPFCVDFMERVSVFRRLISSTQRAAFGTHGFLRVRGRGRRFCVLWCVCVCVCVVCVCVRCVCALCVCVHVACILFKLCLASSCCSVSRLWALQAGGRGFARVQRGQMYQDAFDALAHDDTVSWSRPFSVSILDAEVCCKLMCALFVLVLCSCCACAACAVIMCHRLRLTWPVWLDSGAARGRD